MIVVLGASGDLAKKKTVCDKLSPAPSRPATLDSSSRGQLRL